MKQFLIVLTMLACGISSKAQTAEDSVKAVINKMFLAMKEGNGDNLKSTFSDSLVFQAISKNKDGRDVVKNVDPVGFINFISKEAPGNADERIVFDVVKVDGALAIAWTPYNFYYKGAFSHCGVNSFQLIRLNGEWKIQYLIDTRRKQGCVVQQ
ncbi:hypothetical protein CAP36_00595 [Chitinophagaceae bacterium IBVUCB2]|nr:hypothetical protein CAP36_00595 [Chitinophagaceae bacterium IBVUCB2]